MISGWDAIKARAEQLDERRARPPQRPTYHVDSLSLPVPDIPTLLAWSPDLAARPVVALDLDGVLNVWQHDLQPLPVVPLVINVLEPLTT